MQITKRRSKWAWQEVFKYSTQLQKKKKKLPIYIKNLQLREAVGQPDTAVPGHENPVRARHTNSSCTIKDLSND